MKLTTTKFRIVVEWEEVVDPDWFSPDAEGPETAEEAAQVMREYGDIWWVLREWQIKPRVQVDGVDVWP